MSGLKDRVALVTGGSRGIGKAVALALAEAGATVAVNYRERDNDANAVADAIRTSGGRAAAFGADVSLSAAVQDMVRDIEARFGAIDILVRRRRPYPSWTRRNGRRDRAGCDISRRQRLRDRSDHCGKWRHAFFLRKLRTPARQHEGEQSLSGFSERRGHSDHMSVHALKPLAKTRRR